MDNWTNPYCSFLEKGDFRIIKWWERILVRLLGKEMVPGVYSWRGKWWFLDEPEPEQD